VKFPSSQPKDDSNSYSESTEHPNAQRNANPRTQPSDDDLSTTRDKNDGQLREAPTASLPLDQLSKSTYSSLIRPHLSLIPFFTMPLGIVLLLFGPPLILNRLTTGLVFTSTLVFAVHSVFFKLYSVDDYDESLVVLTCMAFGAAGALLFACLPQLAVFCLAVSSGAVLGSIMDGIMVLIMYPEININPTISLLMFVTVMTLASLALTYSSPKCASVAHSSLVGSWLSVRSVATWVGGWEKELTTNGQKKQIVNLTAYSLYLLAIIVLTAVGCVRQWKVQRGREEYQLIKEYEQGKHSRGRMV